MICISGIPGTGKTTVAALLRERGLNVCDANLISQESGCTEGDVVDIDCMLQRASFRDCDIIEGHFSHLLECSLTVILESDADVIRERLRGRGYAEGKIEENVDAQLSGSIYAEALDITPSTRIHVLNTSDLDPAETAEYVFSLAVFERKE